MWRMLGGGALAAAVLLPLGLVVAGGDAYQQFYQHTLVALDRPEAVAEHISAFVARVHARS